MRETIIDISEEDAEVFDRIAEATKVSRELLDLIGFDAAEAVRFVEETGHVPRVIEVMAIIHAGEWWRPSPGLLSLLKKAKEHESALHGPGGELGMHLHVPYVLPADLKLNSGHGWTEASEREVDSRFRGDEADWAT